MFKSIKQFVESLVGSIVSAYPPSLQEMKSRKMQQLLAEATDSLTKKIVEYQKLEGMGLIRRIVFARTLQNALLQAGYHQTLVREWIKLVVTSITFAKK